MSIYLDSAATTPVLPEAATAALEVMTETFGNPSSLHAQGRLAAARLRANRRTVAAKLGCGPDELFFTSGGTEGNNWAIFSSTEAVRRHGTHIITTAAEHDAVLEPVKVLERADWSVTRLKPDHTGHISTEAFQDALRPETSFVSMMLINNETGARFPVEACAAAAKASHPHLLFHTDAVQAFLKVPFTASALGADLVTVSGHKIGAPKGIGALYIRRGTKLSPLLYGGGQEQNLRSGTEPTAQIAAFAAACAAWNPAASNHMADLKAQAIALLRAVPGLHIISAGDAPHILAVSLPGYPSEMLVRALSDGGIFVSSGSACHRGKPSHVFASMGLDQRTLTGMLRISLCPTSTAEELRTLQGALTEIVRTRISI
ncbi:MAG: cysteine desulfurase [Oscillospiraceae bacterium]|nr:cysteine desulfurase [Oscillospiraceae bacterium]